jgi:HK97 family phage prohead protease
MQHAHNVSGATHTRDMHLRATSLSESERAVECVMSTASIDSYGESIDQASWRLSRFESNPVVLAHHDSRQPIGRAERIRVEDGALKCRIVFARTERAEEIWQLVLDKCLRAVSVGFVPGRVAREERDGRTIDVLYDCTLLELSVVSIPANADALMRAKAQAARAVPMTAASELATLARRPQEPGDIALRVMASDAGMDPDAPTTFTSAARELASLAMRDRDSSADAGMIARSVGLDPNAPASFTSGDRELAQVALRRSEDEPTATR